MSLSSRGLRRTAVAVLGLVLVSTAGVAHADPDPNNPGTYPAGFTDAHIIAGVGADADAELMNGVASAYDTQQPTPADALTSYDAVNPATGAAGDNISTKPGCTLARPNGASAGVTALKLNPLASGAGGDGTSSCIDYARSSRAKKTDGTENNLTFWELASDAVTWVTVGTSYAPRTPLTAMQLADIFTCNDTDWSDVGGQPGAIHVYVPAITSGTYTFFLSKLGNAGITTDDVTNGCGSKALPIQQNDGTRFNADPQGIAPYAVSKWAAQENGAPGIADLRGGAVLGHFDDAVAPVTTTSYNGATYTVLNPAFATGSNHPGRLLYNVTRDSTTFASIFGPTGFICSNADALLIPFGTQPLGSDTTATRYCGKPD